MFKLIFRYEIGPMKKWLENNMKQPAMDNTLFFIFFYLADIFSESFYDPK